MAKSDDHRYSRQIMLPEIGPRGQERLSNACVLIAGAGGLGSVSALYLAAAGVGHLLIADDDQVEMSNLNRQIIHGESTLGRAKALSAALRMADLNSSVQVTQVTERLTHATIDAVLPRVDVIVDACDSFATRQVLNRAALRNQLPFVYGGVAGFDGMVSTFVPGRTACFECVVKGTHASANEGKGVVGPIAGIIASVQSMETLKLLIGIGRPLENRMLRISGLDMRVHVMNFEKNSICPVCGLQNR